jgi:hypothetical protein
VTFEHAQRLTEVLMGLAFIQHSAEHCISTPTVRYLFLPRIVFAALLVIGIESRWMDLGLVFVGALLLRRFQGPYNGGSDRMGFLILLCVCISRWAPSPYWQQIALGYLALQLTLSYAVSGWVKIVRREWRSGEALVDVFRFSAYPVSESLRGFSRSPRLLLVMSWWVMLFEVLFPIALFNSTALKVALVITATFHLLNACLFGLNRFVWIWLAAYPSLLWFQERFVY